MGLLANGGDGFDDSFGENNGGATYDRVLFATRPIAVAQGITGAADSGVPFYLGVAVDRLVEDPLIQYYGYSCTPGLSDGIDDDYSALCDTDGDGLTDLDHGETDDSLSDTDRPDDWAFDQNDDVMEMVYLAIYRGEGITLAGSEADLTVGTYVVNRKQAETNSNILISDAYLKFLWRGIYLEGEILNIRGESSAIALPGAFDAYSDAPDPLYKDVDIWGYVGRAGYVQDSLAVVVEHGYASGDDNVADSMFTGRPIHPDYNVGLLIYEEILARASAAAWGDTAASLWSKGGVYNSKYVFPTLTYRPKSNMELILGYLMVWPDRPDGAIIQCAEGDDVDCVQTNATEDHIGWEVDAALKLRFHEHMLFSLEAGYAAVTDRVPLQNVGLNPEGRFFTLQSRIAYEF